MKNREEKMKINKQCHRDLWDSIYCANIYMSVSGKKRQRHKKN